MPQAGEADESRLYLCVREKERERDYLRNLVDVSILQVTWRCPVGGTVCLTAE